VEPDATALGAADGKQVVGDVPGQIAADAVDLGGQRSLIGRVENEDEIVQKVKETGLDMVGIIHEDDEVTQFDIEGRPLVELPSESNTVKAVNGILSRILK
jgi:CO dehydrogenase nickel-insertion accessory protein CooC1